MKKYTFNSSFIIINLIISNFHSEEEIYFLIMHLNLLMFYNYLKPFRTPVINFIKEQVSAKIYHINYP